MRVRFFLVTQSRDLQCSVALPREADMNKHLDETVAILERIAVDQLWHTVY